MKAFTIATLIAAVSAAALPDDKGEWNNWGKGSAAAACVPTTVTAPAPAAQTVYKTEYKTETKTLPAPAAVTETKTLPAPAAVTVVKTETKTLPAPAAVTVYETKTAPAPAAVTVTAPCGQNYNCNNCGDDEDCKKSCGNGGAAPKQDGWGKW